MNEKDQIIETRRHRLCPEKDYGTTHGTCDGLLKNIDTP